MKREVSLGSEHGSLNDRHDASEGGTMSPQSLRLDRGGSSAEGNEQRAFSSAQKEEAKEAGVPEEDATQLAEPVNSADAEAVRYERLQRKLQAMAAAPTTTSQGRSLGSANDHSPFGSSINDHYPHSPAQGTAGDYLEHHGPESYSASSTPAPTFPLVPGGRPTPLAYDLCDITEEDHSAQFSQSSRLLAVHQNSGTISGNIRTLSSIEHPDDRRQDSRFVLFDRSQSSQMHGLNMNDIPTRNANVAHSNDIMKRDSSNSQQKGETDSSILMDKSFPSSDQQIQITKFAPHTLNNYHSTFPYSAQRSSLHSTPVVATPGGGAYFGVQSQTNGASPSVEDFEKASPILGATNSQHEIFKSSFRSPNPFNAHADYNRVFPTEQRHTYGSGGNSLEYSRHMTGGSVGPDEDVIQPSKSVNSAQFYDLLKEHRNFMSSQPELADGFNRHMSQRVLQKNMSLKKAAGSGTTPFGGTREVNSSMRRSVQGPNTTHPDARPQSDEDLLSHMSRLSQLVPNHDQLENGDSQRGSQASKKAALKPPSQQQMLQHFQRMEQKLNSLQNQMQVRDQEVEDLKNQNEKLNTKLAAESTNVKVLQSRRDLKAGSGRFTGRNDKMSINGLQRGKSSVQLNSEKNQMVDDFDSAFSGSNRHGSKGGTGPIHGLTKHIVGAASGQSEQQAVVHQKDELAKLITEGSESSANKMEFQADEYDQESEILAIKKELSSHTHPSIASPPDRSPNRSAGIGEGRPSITSKTGSSHSNNRSTRLFPSFGDGEQLQQSMSQQKSFQMAVHQKVAQIQNNNFSTILAGPIVGQRKDLEQNGMTTEQLDFGWEAHNAQKNGQATTQKEADAADAIKIQDLSLESSHQLNETSEIQAHAGQMQLYTSVTHNQSDSSFEKDFGELRGGNPGQGLLEAKDGYPTEVPNQGEAKSKTPPLVPELFSINSSIEKKDKKDVRQGQDVGLEEEEKQPKGKTDEMLRQQLFGKQNSMTGMSPVGSAGSNSRKKWQIKNRGEQPVGASKDAEGEDDLTPVFQYDPEVAKSQQISQSVRITRIDKAAAAHNNSVHDKPFEMQPFDVDDHQDKSLAEKKADAKSNGQPPRMQHTVTSPENKEFTLRDVRAAVACSPAQGAQKFSLSVPNSHQATAERQDRHKGLRLTRNASNVSNASSLGSRARREGKRATPGPLGAKDRSKATKSRTRLGGSSVGTYSEGKDAETGQSAQNISQNISRSQADNSDAGQSFADPSRTNVAPERVRALQQKATAMKAQIQNHEKENFALREKITNLKRLYHKKQDQVQDWQRQHEQSLRKQEELKEALEDRQNIIDSHQVEIEELKKQNLQGTRSQFSQIDIKNKETQIYTREFTKDYGCQVDFKDVLDIGIQPPQSQPLYATSLMNGYMPPMIHPYVYASMAAPPWTTPTPEPLSASFTPVGDVIDKMIMRDSFDLNRELNPNKEASSQMENTNDPKAIRELVRQCKKYEAAQQKLQTEINQEQQQMAQMAMLQPMMAMSMPSTYQSLYADRAAEQLGIKTDQNILLEKANIQLQGKLMHWKEKYAFMKEQFQQQLEEQDALNSELPGQRGNRRMPQMTSPKNMNGQKSREGQSQSPTAQCTIQNFDHFNSLISNQLAKYKSSQSQTDPSWNTAQPQANNQLHMQRNPGSAAEESSQYLQGIMNPQYQQMLDRQGLQRQPDEVNGLVMNDNIAHVAVQSSEHGELVNYEASSQAAAKEGRTRGPDEFIIHSRKQSFNQQLQLFDQRQQQQQHHERKRSLQQSSPYGVCSGQFYQQNSATRDLGALDAYADLEHGGYDSEGAVALPDSELPPQTEATPVVRYSQDGSKMSGPMRHPVTISKWLIPVNGQTMNSHNVNSAEYANELGLQRTQSAVATAYMQELPQNSHSQVKATASAFDIRDQSQQQSELEQSNEQMRPEKVMYYRREAHQSSQSAGVKAKGKRGFNQRQRSRNSRTTANGSHYKNKSWSNQNAGLITKIDVRKQHNSGSKPRVTRILPTTSSPAKTAQSRRDLRSGWAVSSVRQQRQNTGKGTNPAQQVPSGIDGLKANQLSSNQSLRITMKPDSALQEAQDAYEAKNQPQNQVSCTFYSERHYTEESEVLTKPKDQDIALRVHAKRRQRLNGSRNQQLAKSFSPEKATIEYKRARGEVYQPQLKESACAWYIPSLQRVVPNGTSKRRTGKTQTKNTKKARESHILSFGQDEEFNAKKKAVESRNNVDPVPKAQDEEQHYQSLNLDIRTSDRNDGRNTYNVNDIQPKASRSNDEVEVLVQDAVQDQAVPQLDGLPSVEYQDKAQISNRTRERQVQAEENTFQLSSSISPGATFNNEPGAHQTFASSLQLAGAHPVGSYSSTAEANALKQLAENQRIKTEESGRSEYPSARHLDPVVTAHPNADVSDAQLDSEFDQMQKKEYRQHRQHIQQLRQQKQHTDEKKAMKAAHLKNVMAQLQRLKDQQASVDHLSQEELNLASFRTSQNQRQKLDEIRRKYSAPI